VRSKAQGEVKGKRVFQLELIWGPDQGTFVSTTRKNPGAPAWN
jgi:hypothetical protein